MVFEFGTMDSQTIIGSFLSLKNMIYENQGFHHGYVDENSKKSTHEDFLNMFNPSEETWRNSVLEKAMEALKNFSLRYSELNVIEPQ